MGSGLVGALVYTFSDTFLVLCRRRRSICFLLPLYSHCILADSEMGRRGRQPHSDRWLILIAYLTGLSIGVHLLNLPLSAGNRIGVLLQENSERHCQRLIASPARDRAYS